MLSTLVNFIFFVLAHSVVLVDSTDVMCDFTPDRPEITVVNSTHVRVNWENSFKSGCDDGQVKSAQLKIRRLTADYSYLFNPKSLLIDFEAKIMKVEADPCLQHDMIKVELEHGPTSRNVISHTTGYNADWSNSCKIFKPDNIYGGLLKDRVCNKTCKKEDGKYLIPDVPKEVQHCVQKTEIDKESKQLSFTVVSPCHKNSHADFSGIR